MLLQFILDVLPIKPFVDQQYDEMKDEVRGFGDQALPSFAAESGDDHFRRLFADLLRDRVATSIEERRRV